MTTPAPPLTAEELDELGAHLSKVGHWYSWDESLVVSREKLLRLIATARQHSAPSVGREALKTAISHIEHMANWIGMVNRGEARGTYSFEALGEDMPGIKARLDAPPAGDRVALEKIAKAHPGDDKKAPNTYRGGFDQGLRWAANIAREALAQTSGEVKPSPFIKGAFADRIDAREPATPTAEGGELADVLVMTACKDRAELEDMANIGRSFMERMGMVIECPGAFHRWSPADDPTELVTDLFNALEEATPSPDSGVHAGFVLVPREPTRKMLTAFAVAFAAPAPKGPSPTNTLDRMDLLAATIWQAVVSAAPAPATGQEWKDISEAKKDGATIWAVLRPDIYPVLEPGRDDLERWNGVQVPLRHPGLAEDGFDIGWNVAAPVGNGGFPDEWIAGWIPLPAPPVPAEGETP